MSGVEAGDSIAIVRYAVDDVQLLYRARLTAESMYRPNHARHSPKKRALCGSLALLGAAASLSLLIYAELHRFNKAWALAAFVPTCFAATQLIDDRAKRAKAADEYVRRYMASTVVRQHMGEHTVRLTTSGVELTSPVEQVTVRWEGVRHFFKEPGYAVVWLDRGCEYIPESACATAGGAEAFIATGQRCLDERGLGFPADLRAHLASHDIRCPGCRYSLRNNTSLICPECSRPLTPNDLPQVWQVKP